MSLSFISSSFSQSSSFYIESGGLSSSLQSGSYTITVSKTLGSLGADFSTDTISFTINSSSAGGSNDITALSLSGSGDIPLLGIGTLNPLSNLDIRSITSSDPANVTLRTNEDGVIEVGEETGRVIFAIESASYLGTDFTAKGSTATIYSQVINSTPAGSRGSLIFEVSKNDNVTPIEIMRLGHGFPLDELQLGGIYTTANRPVAFLSASMIIDGEDGPYVHLRGGINSGNPYRIADLGVTIESADELFDAQADYWDRGSLKLFHNNVNKVDLNSYADYDWIDTGKNLGIGTKTPTHKLHVVGDIKATGDIIAQRYIVSSSVSHITSSFSSGSTVFGDTLDDTHQFTGSLDVNGDITVTGTVDGVDIATLKSDFDTLEGKTLVSGSSQITIGSTTGTITSAKISDVDAFSQSGTYASLRAQGTTAADVGLGNVTNESKATMFTNAALTGNPTAPTPLTSDNDTSIATTAFVKAQGYTTNTGTVDTSGTPVDNDFAKFTDANTIEGRSYSEVKTDLSLNNVENTALSTYTGNGGALDNQYITNGAGYTTNTGTVTSVGGTGTVSGLSLSGTVTTSGNLTLGGTISISSTNITDVDAFSQSGTYASLRAQGTTKGDVGLGNVENTALSTYTGNGGALDNQYITNGAGYTTNTGTVDTSGTPVDNDFAKFTDANTIEGRSYSEVKTDLSLNNVENTALSTYTGNGGALDNQYITNGAGYTTNTGTVTSVGGTGTVSGLSLSGTVTTSGNLTLGGTISISSANITDVDAFSQSGTYASLRAQGTTAADVGLGNVENTALSTYTGNGGALDNQYITNGAGYLTTVDISTDTNLVGGTNLTLSGDTMNLDESINLTTVSVGGYNSVSAAGTVLDIGAATEWTTIRYGKNGAPYHNFQGRLSTTGDITASSNVDIQGTLSLPGFSDVSASLAAAVAGGDNLGNHTATQNLNMGTYAITNVGNVDGVDVSTLKSDFDTLEGKTLVSSSAQIADVTLTTAAQTNITSLGTLSSLTMGGDIDTDGNSINVNSGEVNGAASIDANVFKMGSGGVTTPSLAFTSDSNTGLYGVAADTLGIAAGGQNKISIGSTTTSFSNNIVSISATDGDSAVLSVTNNFNSITSADHYGLKVQGGGVIFTGGGSKYIGYGIHTTAGPTNTGTHDTIALFAQGDVDGEPHSYAAIFSGSAGGVVGINTMEPTVELDVVGDGKFSGTLEIGGISDVSASIAAAGGGGGSDNLGNHTATQDLDLSSNNIKGITHITASGNISASGIIVPQYDTKVSTFFTSDANGDLIPMGGTLNETTTPQYYINYMSPYGGQLIRAYVMTTSSSTGAFTLSLRRYTNFSTFTTIATATGTINSSYTPTLATFTAHTFSAGDWLAIYFDPTGTPSGVNVTSLWRMDSI